MYIVNNKYDIVIAKKQDILVELNKEIELIRPLKLKITQYKQATETIEEEIRLIKENEKIEDLEQGSIDGEGEEGHSEQ